MHFTIIGLLVVALKLGVQTPGVQIPVVKLKPDAVENSSDFSPSCAGKLRGFGADWLLNCSEGTLSRLDIKTGEVSKTLKTGGAAVRAGLAISSDSLWVFSDTKTTLSRVDPAENQIVAEMRLPAGCNS